MCVVSDRRRRIAQGRTSTRILNTEVRSVDRPNVGRQAQRPALRNVWFVMFMAHLMRVGDDSLLANIKSTKIEFFSTISFQPF